jgi:RimJ/RimL family protein N-acetyltransferase
MNRETERLFLRQWRLEDFEAYASYYADENLARFVGGPCDRESAWRKMASLAGHWVLRDFGYWAVEEKGSGDFVGCVGLWQSDGWPEVELGYLLMPDKQGRGYATEAGREAQHFARCVAKISSLVSYIDPRNAPSIRVAERLGGRFDGAIDLLDFGRHNIYRYDP